MLPVRAGPTMATSPAFSESPRTRRRPAGPEFLWQGGDTRCDAVGAAPMALAGRLGRRHRRSAWVSPIPLSDLGEGGRRGAAQACSGAWRMKADVRRHRAPRKLRRLRSSPRGNARARERATINGAYRHPIARLAGGLRAHLVVRPSRTASRRSSTGRPEGGVLLDAPPMHTAAPSPGSLGSRGPGGATTSDRRPYPARPPASGLPNPEAYAA